MTSPEDNVKQQSRPPKLALYPSYDTRHDSYQHENLESLGELGRPATAPIL